MTNETKVREQLLERCREKGFTMIAVGVSARQILAAMKNEDERRFMVFDEADDLVNRLQPSKPPTGKELQALIERPVEERPSNEPFRHWPMENQPRSHRKKNK